MSARRTVGWVALAAVGVLLAVALTMAATELTSQRVGLQAEPLNAGSELAPQLGRRDRDVRKPDPERETTVPEPEPIPTPAPTDDDEGEFEIDDDNSGSDSSGRGRGRGRGRGGDDDD